jgi:hypothetical protein
VKILLIGASLMLAACDPHMEKVQQDKTPPVSETSPPPPPGGSVANGSQTNTANQANAPTPSQR